MSAEIDSIRETKMVQFGNGYNRQNFWLVEAVCEEGPHMPIGISCDGHLLYAENWRHALQFTRKKDAERFKAFVFRYNTLPYFKNLTGDFIVAEHGYML